MQESGLEIVWKNDLDMLCRLSSKEFKPATDKIWRTMNEINNYQVQSLLTCCRLAVGAGWQTNVQRDPHCTWQYDSHVQCRWRYVTLFICCWICTVETLALFSSCWWHTHLYVCFEVKRRRRWLMSKSSFSRQCVGRIRDTCSQLTWKSHSLHTHGGTFRPTLTPGQTLYLHESCQNKPNLKFVKRRRRLFALLISASQVHRSYSWYMQPVDPKLTHTHTHNHTMHTHAHHRTHRPEKKHLKTALSPSNTVNCGSDENASRGADTAFRPSNKQQWQPTATQQQYNST